jgi:hypothetical protein
MFERHPRDDLSAYLDGALTAGRVQRIDAHLGSCEACTVHLEGLRQARAVLRSLPQAEAPRSFALTPEMARRPVAGPAPQRGVQPLVGGLRVASGGLAVAFVLALIAAVGAGGNGNSSSDDAAVRVQLADVTSSAEYSAGGSVPSASQAMEDRDAAATTTATAPATPSPAPTAQGVIPTPALPQTGGVSGGGGNSGGSGGVAGGGGAGGVGGAGSSGGSPMGPTSAPVPPDATAAADAIVSPSATDVNQESASATEIPKAITELQASASGEDVYDAATGSSSDGGGVDWTLAAVVFGALLGVTVIGSIAASRLASREA